MIKIAAPQSRQAPQITLKAQYGMWCCNSVKRCYEVSTVVARNYDIIFLTKPAFICIA